MKQLSKTRSKTSRTIKLIASTLLAASFVSSSTYAAETYKFYTGARMLGMGGAYTAVVNDETALLTNPAGLGKIRDVIFTLADPELHGAMKNTEVTNLNSTAVQTPSDLLVNLNQHKGVHWHAKAQAFPSIVSTNIGFGVLGKWQYDAEVNTAGTNYRYDYTQDFAGVLGFCFRLFGGIVKIGGAGRYINRTEMHKDFDPTVTTIDFNQNASEGRGLAADAGLILTAPVAGLPTLAAVVRDAGTTSYAMGTGMFHQTTTRPVDTPQTIDVGFSINPILSNHTRMTITGDYHDIANANRETDMAKKIHAGLEFNFADFFFLRGGYNQRYWTAGFELATQFFQFQAASYGEEIGVEGAFREDRRWVGKFSIRF